MTTVTLVRCGFAGLLGSVDENGLSVRLLSVELGLGTGVRAGNS